MSLKIPVFIITGAVVLAVAVVMMRVPSTVPEWAEQRHVLQRYVVSFYIAGVLAHPISWLTGSDYIQGVRYVINALPLSQDFNSPSMKVTRTELGGVPAEVFQPQPAEDSSPAIIFIHGGGWSIVELDFYESTCNHMAEKYNVVVIAVDYRQAPEHPYPTPFEDCLKAVMHVLHNAQSLGLDPKRIAIAGDSAGGNLAAAVALRLSQKDMASKLPPLQFQVLIYPALQMLDLNTQSYNNFSTGGPLTKHLMTRLWLSYLGYPELHPLFNEFQANNHSTQLLKNPLYASYLDHGNLPEGLRDSRYKSTIPESSSLKLASEVESRMVDPYFAPLLASDVSRVPPAYFVLANIDVLRDDGFLYATRLREAGVSTEVDFYPGMSHGFCVIPAVEAMQFDRAVEAFEKLGSYVGENL